MGIESDQEVVQMVGSEAYYADMMSSSLEECCGLQVFTQKQALEFIGHRVKIRQQRKPKPKASHCYYDSVVRYILTPEFAYLSVFLVAQAEEARHILASVVLSHVPVTNFDFRIKCIYVGLMIRRILLAMRDPSTMDDKDYYGNKRLELYISNILVLLR